jgi:integrase
MKKSAGLVKISGSKYVRVVAPAGFDGIRQRKAYYLKTKSAAEDFRWRIKRWKADQNLPPTDKLEFDETDKQWIAYLRAHIGDLSQLPAIIGHWEKTAKRILNPLSVAQLCDEFIEYRGSKSHNKRTLSDMRHRVGKFADHYGQLKAHEVTTEQFRKFLDSADSPTSSRNDYKVLSVLLRFARERRVITINPLDEIKRPESSHADPGILKPEELGRLLKTADQKFPTLLPFVALSGFAGLRTSELVSMYAYEKTLEWKDIIWDKRLIHIRPDVAKTTKRKSGDRRYVPMEDALIHWLEPHRKNSGQVVPYAESWFRKLLRGTKKEPGKDDPPSCYGLFRTAGVKPVDNGLRHSYASYQLAKNGKEGFGRLAVNMGNSEAVIKKHYVEVLTPEDSQAWFGIRRG